MAPVSWMVSLVVLASTPAPNVSPGYRIIGISGHLYYQETGRFGPNDVFGRGVALLNVTEGLGGDIVVGPDGKAVDFGPSAATLMLVEVTGPTTGKGGLATITIVAREDAPGATTLAKSTSYLTGYHTENGRVFVPLLVDGTGCVPVKVTASIADDGKTLSSLSKVVEFQCGE